MSGDLDRGSSSSSLEQSKPFRKFYSKACLKTTKNVKFDKVNFMSGELDRRQQQQQQQQQQHQQPGAEQESNRLNLKSFKQQKHLSQRQTTVSGSYRLTAFLHTAVFLETKLL